MSLYLSDVRIITSMYGRSLCSRNWKQMMWINSILQGKNEEKEMTLEPGNSVGLGKVLFVVHWM